MPNIPAWVSDGSIRKFHRALEVLRKEGKEATDANVKELYVKWGGLVIEVAATHAAPAATSHEVAAPIAAGVDAKPAKKGK